MVASRRPRKRRRSSEDHDFVPPQTDATARTATRRTSSRRRSESPDDTDDVLSRSPSPFRARGRKSGRADSGAGQGLFQSKVQVLPDAPDESHRVIIDPKVRSREELVQASEVPVIDEAEHQWDSDWEPSTPPLPPRALVCVAPDNGIEPSDEHIAPDAPSSPGQTPIESSRSPSLERDDTPDSPAVPRKSIFDIHDDDEEAAIFAQMQQLLAGSDDEDSDSQEENATYEERRQKRVLKNRAMLLQLGLAPAETSGSAFIPEADDQAAEAPSRAVLAGDDEEVSVTGAESSRRREGRKGGDGGKRARRKSEAVTRRSQRRQGRIQLKLGDDGTTTTIPLQGTTHQIAYIHLLPTRARDHWILVEDFPIVAPKPPTPTPSPPRSPVAAKTGKVRVVRSKEASGAKQQVVPEIVKLEGDGSSCHQCRRKTGEAKMSCRQCPLLWCWNCMDVRYGAWDPFDVHDRLYAGCRDVWRPDNSNWLCPRCRGICNCSLCLIKGGFKHLLPPAIGPQGKRLGTLSLKIRGPKKERAFRSARHYLESQGVTHTAKFKTDAAVSTSERTAVLEEMHAEERLLALEDQISFIEAELVQLRSSANTAMKGGAISTLDVCEASLTNGASALENQNGVSAQEQKQLQVAPTAASNIGQMVQSADSKLSSPQVAKPAQRLILRLRRPKTDGDTTMPPPEHPPVETWSPLTQKPFRVHPRPSAKNVQLSRAARELEESKVWVKGNADIELSESDSEFDELEEDAGDRSASKRTAAHPPPTNGASSRESSTLSDPPEESEGRGVADSLHLTRQNSSHSDIKANVAVAPSIQAGAAPQLFEPPMHQAQGCHNHHSPLQPASQFHDHHSHSFPALSATAMTSTSATYGPMNAPVMGFGFHNSTGPMQLGAYASPFRGLADSQHPGPLYHSSSIQYTPLASQSFEDRNLLLNNGYHGEVPMMPQPPSTTLEDNTASTNVSLSEGAVLRDYAQ